MIYKDFKGLKLSMLGMGGMRFPLIEGTREIDSGHLEKMVDYAMKCGINYYDTAWGYHHGTSQTELGKALKKYPRESFYLANKFPGYDLSMFGKAEEIFEKQLERCGVDYFDFYLFHNLCESNIDYYLNPEYNTLEYLVRQKNEGKIRHLGVSVHGSLEILERFLEVYGEHIEFCQIQLNYIDWEFQEAKKKVELLNRLNIPVWVMEPLRGGKLANVSSENEAKLKAIRQDENSISMAFRFLQSVKGVTVILSGMSDFEQLSQNIKIFEKDKPLNECEFEKMLDYANGMLSNTLPCTACNYCTEYCPSKLDIPTLLRLYNEHSFTGGGFIAPMVLSTIPKEKHPSACIGCRSCEAVCPQGLKISQAMHDFSDRLK